MQQLNIKITPLTPLVLTQAGSSAILTESADAIAGSIVRGVLATRYIESRRLGANAHLDAEFCQLFASELAFTPAYAEARGAGRGFPVPLSLQRNKINKSDVRDLITTTPEKGYKNMSGTVAIVPEAADVTLATTEVAKKISLHMSRSSDRERIAGRSEDGGIFNYESVLPGTTFIASVIGERETLEALVAGLALESGGLDCYIGRSRSTQYGKAHLELADIEEAQVAIPEGSSVWLRLDSAMLGYDLASSATAVLDELFIALADELGVAEGEVREHFSLGQKFARATTVDSMVGVWQMHRPTAYGLQAGSIFELKKDAPFTQAERAALARIMLAGVGARTSEGYGQLRVWTVGPMHIEKMAKPTISRKPAQDAQAAELVRRILLRRVLERVAAMAYTDASNIAGNLRGKTHALVRLENMLTTLPRGENLAQRFQDKFTAELRPKSAFEKNLQSLRLRGIALNKILDGTNDLPYARVNLADEIETELATEVGFSLADYESDIFYTYHLWLFRHARKLAVRKEAGDNE